MSKIVNVPKGVEVFDQLAAPFPPERVSWRVGSMTADKTRGMALAYIDARDVQDRFDTVCGPGNWQNRFATHGAATVCEIGVRLAFLDGDKSTVEWIWKADGAGETDVEGAKGQFSDSFKRAAVQWGVGRYLYSLESPWVQVRDKRIVPEEMARLRSILTKAGSGGPYIATEDTLPPRITADQAQTLREMLERSGANIEKFCARFRIGSVPDLLSKDYERAVAAINLRDLKLRETKNG